MSYAVRRAGTPLRPTSASSSRAARPAWCLCSHVAPHGWLVECSETSAQEMWRVEAARWATSVETKRLEAIRNLSKEDGR